MGDIDERISAERDAAVVALIEAIEILQRAGSTQPHAETMRTIRCGLARLQGARVVQPLSARATVQKILAVDPE